MRKLRQKLDKAFSTALGKFALGVIDGPTFGIASNILAPKTQSAPSGTPDSYAMLAGQVVSWIVVAYLLSKGVITLEEGKELLEAGK